jgi:hypothetical protein
VAHPADRSVKAEKKEFRQFVRRWLSMFRPREVVHWRRTATGEKFYRLGMVKRHRVLIV